jgi:hypothetical protein
MYLRKVAVVVAGVSGSTLSAQELRGTLRSQDGTAAAGAVIQVLQAVGGGSVGISRVGHDGAIRVLLRPDSVVVRVLRVGFRPETLLVARLRAGESRDLSRQLSAGSVNLPAAIVQARSRCDVDNAEMNRWTTAMFEQVIAVLRATKTSLQEPGPVVRAMVDTVKLTADDRYTLSNRTTVVRTTMIGPEFADTTGIRRRGFRTVARTGERSYRLPGPDFFLGSMFLESHCLHFAGFHPSDRQLVGLGFAPLDTSNSVVGLAGTFWLRASDASPTQLDLRFVDLEPAAREGRPVGSLELTPAADATWYFSRWSTRMPQVRTLTVTPRDRSRPSSITVSLSGILTVSGEILEVRDGKQLTFSSASTDSVDTRGRRVGVGDSTSAMECSARSGFAALTGRVLLPTSDTAVGFEVIWRDFTWGRTASNSAPAAVRDDGTFLMCEFPTGRPIELMLRMRGSSVLVAKTSVRLPAHRTEGRLPTWSVADGGR